MQDLKDTKYLIAAYHPLNDDLRQKIKEGRIVEKSYYRILQQNDFAPDDFILDYYNFEQEKIEIDKLLSKPFTEIDFVPFSFDKEIKDIFESISAFSNSGGGTIIFGQETDFKKHFSEQKINFLCDEIWKKMMTEFPEMKDYLIIYSRDYLDRKFLEIEIIPTPFECRYRGEYFIRTIHGNVLDLEKSFL